MRKWKLEVLVVFVCVVLYCVSVVPAEVVATPAGEKLSNTRTAVCMMIVSADPDIFPLWEENINTLVLSTGVGMRAVKGVLGTDEYVVKDFINYHINRPAPGVDIEVNRIRAVYMTVQVELGDREVPSAAVELLDAFVSNFTEALEGAFEDYKGSFDNQRDAAEIEARDAEEHVMQLQHELRKLSGSRDLTPKVVRDEIRDNRIRLENAEMNRASLQGDTEAYSRQIAVNEATLKEKLKTDVILKELEQVVEINQKKVQQLRKLSSQGLATDVDVSKTLEEVARARIELARRKDELTNNLPGIPTSSLTSKLAQYAIRRTQMMYEIMALNERLAESRGLIEKADRYEIQVLKLGLAKRNLEDAIMWRDDLKRQMRIPVSPSVIVMGAE